jgi:hypothetical protein
MTSTDKPAPPHELAEKQPEQTFRLQHTTWAELRAKYDLPDDRGYLIISAQQAERELAQGRLEPIDTASITFCMERRGEHQSPHCDRHAAE